MKNQNKVVETGVPQSQLSALSLKNYQLVFLRRHLGKEKVTPDLGKTRNDFLFNTLIPTLDAMDNKILAIRDKYSEKLANGNIRTNPETDEIEYGENEAIARQEFGQVLSDNVILPIVNKNEFSVCRDIFASLKQELNEEETTLFFEIVDILKSVEL